MFIARKQIGCEDFTGKAGGEGITIAVLDTGISTHPDFGGRILAFRDFVNDMPYVYDDSGHGTHVCGIAAGNGLLSRGRYRGVAPGASLVVGKVLNEQGDGSVDAMLKGLSWILENKDRWKIRIVNISVGFGGTMPEKKEMLLRVKMEEAWEEGLRNLFCQRSGGSLIPEAGLSGTGDGNCVLQCFLPEGGSAYPGSLYGKKRHIHGNAHGERLSGTFIGKISGFKQGAGKVPAA